MGALERTTNFLDLYLYYVGQSEVPGNFHLWCAMSVLAACVTDRVWIDVDEGRKVYPNLYVFLIGPSGSGKGHAINMAYKLVEGVDVLNTYAGMATKQAFIDWISKGAKLNSDGVRIVDNPIVYFVTEELAMAMRPGDLAHDLITLMTGMFMRPSFPITEGTRGRGFVQMKHACFNWLAGSNEQWLVKSIPKDAMETGFLARVCIVQGRRQSGTRYPRPIYPKDFEEVKAHLKQRVEALTWVEGAYTLTDRARKVHDEWYETRPEPLEKSLDAAFFRADEMVYKFALLLALAEWPGTFGPGGVCEHPTFIDDIHMEEAIALWDDLAFDVPEVVGLASASPQSSDVLVVREIIQRYERICRSDLTIAISKRGLNKDRLDKGLATLFDEERVEMTMEPTESGRTRRWYTWKS